MNTLRLGPHTLAAMGVVAKAVTKSARAGGTPSSWDVKRKRARAGKIGTRKKICKGISYVQVLTNHAFTDGASQYTWFLATTLYFLL